jgi:hypothetical protein
MSQLPEWLRPLLDASILQHIAVADTVHVDQEDPPTEPVIVGSSVVSSVSASIAHTNSTEDVASFASNILPLTSIEPPTGPQVRAKKSIMLKAYAHSIRALLTPENDLGLAGQAMFVASPLQKGVPLGVAEPYLNEAIYQHGNAVQSPLSPIYRAGSGDYFGWLNLCVYVITR